jgi:hypothetical protein
VLEDDGESGRPFENEMIRFWPTADIFGRNTEASGGADEAKPLVNLTAKQAVFRMNPSPVVL